jgi:DNA-binding transcriptional regulator YiaG
VAEAVADAVDEALALAKLRRQCRSGEARARREAANLGQAETARLIGVAPWTLCKWEGGTRTPRGGAALRYAELLRRLA